jgi:hypothetical protein
MTAYIDYNRLSYLGDRVQAGLATKEETNEYMCLLCKGGHITQKQYDDYAADRNRQEIVNAALAIGAIVLIGYVLKEIFDQK